MDSDFFKKVDDIKVNICNQLEELKLLYVIDKSCTFGTSEKINFDKLLPMDAVMPSDELVKRCREYSDKKYVSKIHRYKTQL